MKLYTFDYRVIYPGFNYSTYTDFFDQPVVMCDYAEPLSYYVEHFVYDGDDPLIDQRLTLVGWGAHCCDPVLVFILWSEFERRTYLMRADGVKVVL